VLPERSAYWFVSGPGQQPDDNLGSPVVVACGKVVAFAVNHVHQVATFDIAVDPLYRSRKDPGVAIAHRFFATGL
jgi:hypothetical protein